MSIIIPSAQTFVSYHKQITSLQQSIEETAAISFSKDLEKSRQFYRLIENKILHLKHKLIPDAVKANKTEVLQPILLDSFLSGWITNDPITKELALKSLINVLATKLPNSFTVTKEGDNLKISWKNNG